MADEIAQNAARAGGRRHGLIERRPHSGGPAQVRLVNHVTSASTPTSGSPAGQVTK